MERLMQSKRGLGCWVGRCGLALTLVAGTVACGSSDNNRQDPGGTSGPFPPATATSSDQGFVDFIQSLVMGNNETDQPAALTGDSPSGDETAAPVDI